ncbi:MAG TPA: hypothetical protein VLL25_04500 [Acidimicrobiales bacterium]|nr:hypothetical protein [Acidimicrobiales bacterium]
MGGSDKAIPPVAVGRAPVAAGVGMAVGLLQSATNASERLSDRLELVAEAKQLLAELGGGDETSTVLAGQLLAARDDLSALLLSAYMLDEVGVAEAVTGDLLNRGIDRCQQRLQGMADTWGLHHMAESVL